MSRFLNEIVACHNEFVLLSLTLPYRFFCITHLIDKKQTLSSSIYCILLLFFTVYLFYLLVFVRRISIKVYTKVFLFCLIYNRKVLIIILYHLIIILIVNLYVLSYLRTFSHLIVSINIPLLFYYRVEILHYRIVEGKLRFLSQLKRRGEHKLLVHFYYD